MTKIFSAAAALLFIGSVSLSCTHQARRGPASIEEVAEIANSCRDGFDRQYSDEIEGLSDAASWPPLMAYIEGAFQSEVEATLKSLPEDKCQRSRVIKDLLLSVNGKRVALRALEREIGDDEGLITARLSQGYISDPRFGEAVACHLQCMNENPHLAYSDRVLKCSKPCDVDSDFLRAFQSSPVEGLSMRCNGVVNGDIIFQVSSFRREFESFRDQLNSFFQDRRSILTTLEFQAGGVRQILRGLERDIMKYSREEPRCTDSEAIKLNPIKKALVKMDLPESRGTGFYAAAGGGVRLITAQHVFLNGQAGASEIPVTLKKNKYPKGKPQPDLNVVMTRTKGLYSDAADVIQKSVDYSGDLLPVVPGRELPKVGQTFYIAGFPMMRDFRFSLFRCRLAGFDILRTVNSEGWSYVLNCPAPQDVILGMSGGPVLDPSGRVWGVISGHSLILGRVYAAPLSLTGNGELKMGLSMDFMSDHCLAADMTFTRRCQVGGRGD